jgi:ankyrin repeat protein
LHIAQDNAEIVALLLTCDSIRGAAGTGSVIDEHFFYDAHYRRGTTPLMTAVQFNFERAVAALLACDTVAHTAGAQDGLGRTALIHAVRGGRSPGLLRSLLACEQVRSAGNAHDHDGFTALVHAIVQCDDVAVSVLLECKDIADTAGAPIAGGGFFPGFTPGFTPLMLASEGKNARVTKALLACPHVQQTAFSARNVHGENAYDLACKRGDNVDVAQWIAAFRPTTPFT